MKNKTMYFLHELIMCLGTLIGGAAVVGGYLTANPEAKEKLKTTFGKVKGKLRKKKHLKIVVVDENGNPIK